MNWFNPIAPNFTTYCKEKYGTIENLQLKAKSGEITAQVDLGMAYSEGLGKELPKDVDEAIGWLHTAVEGGCELPFTLAKLGELLDRKGTIQDRRMGYEMYQRAARLGCTSSQINLAEMYRCGVEGVVNKDLSEAFEWYKKAAGENPSNSGSPDLGGLGKLLAGTMKRVETALGDEQKKSALLCLYKYYLAGDCPEARPQPTKAIYYLTRTAELGDTEAQLELGLVYLHGGCEQGRDVARAKRWLEKAASNGDAKAKEVFFLNLF